MRCAVRSRVLEHGGLVLLAVMACRVAEASTLEVGLGWARPLRDFAAAQGTTAKLQAMWFGEAALHSRLSPVVTIGGALSVAPTTRYVARSPTNSIDESRAQFDGPSIWRATLEARRWDRNANGFLGVGLGLAYYRSDGVGCAAYDGNPCYAVQEHSGGYTRPVVHVALGVFGFPGLSSLGLRIEDSILLQEPTVQHDAGASIVYAFTL